MLAFAVAKDSLAHLKTRMWQSLRPNSPWSKCRHVKDSSSGGSGVKWLLTLAACLKSAAGGARLTGGASAPPCADTLPPCHPASATPAALAAVVGDLLDASWGGPNPFPRGGPHPAVEVVDVEGALPVHGAGVNPLPGGDSKPCLGGGSNPRPGGGSNPCLGGGSNPRPGGGAHPPVEVLAGEGAGALGLEGGQQVSSLQRLLIFCHWIEGNSSFCRSRTSWAVTPLWRSSA